MEPFSGLNAVDELDIAIDGADQVAPSGWVVKGGGAAHTREKAVAAAAARFVVIVSADKLVERLRPPVPLELLEFGVAATLRRLGSVELRDVPRSPDGGVIADYTAEFDDPAHLAAKLSATVGVVEHGLFPPELVADVVVGRGDESSIARFASAGSRYCSVESCRASTQRRKPPRNASSLCPSRQFGGSSPRTRALPPPRTT